MDNSVYIKINFSSLRRQDNKNGKTGLRVVEDICDSYNQ